MLHPPVQRHAAVTCGRKTTVLSGRVRDDSQLYGFIERISELGLELLMVQRLSEQDMGGKDRKATEMSDESRTSCSSTRAISVG